MKRLPLAVVLLTLIWTFPAQAQTGRAATAASDLKRPRLFITQQDIPRLRALPTQTQVNALGFAPADGWKKIQAQADKFLKAPTYSYTVKFPVRGKGARTGRTWSYTLSDTAPPKHDWDKAYPPWTAMFQERPDSITTRIKYLTLAYKVTGDRKYFDRAKKIVLHLCAWSTIWSDPSYSSGRPCLDTGHAATWVGRLLRLVLRHADRIGAPHDPRVPGRKGGGPHL